MGTFCFLGVINKHLFPKIGNEKCVRQMISLKSSFVKQFFGLCMGPRELILRGAKKKKKKEKESCFTKMLTPLWVMA